MSKAVQFISIALMLCQHSFALVARNNEFQNHLPSTERLKKAFNTGNMSLTPSAFTENKGQLLGWDRKYHPEVKFFFRRANVQIFLLEKGIAYQFTRTHYSENSKQLSASSYADKYQDVTDTVQKQIRTETFRMDMNLLGAAEHPKITTKGKSADYTNFYKHGVLDVHQYSEITYHDVYPGIDWIIYSRNGQVKYDFVIRPGADAALIKMEFIHQEGISINDDGSFTFKNSMGSFSEEKPECFQGTESILSRFKLSGAVISFELAQYNHDQELVIDPAVTWATYYGDTDPEEGLACTTDGSGNIYLAGVTKSSANIANGGHQNFFGGDKDAFLVKFDNNGVRLWATYYGGTGEDIGTTCATDGSGNVYLAGHTSSNTGTLIATIGSHQQTHAGIAPLDAFLVKFNSNGIRQWGTYYGGTAIEKAFSCVTDASGNIYLAGWTADPGQGPGSTAIATPGSHQPNMSYGYDAFLVKFNSSGVRQWGTYYGEAGIEFGSSCATDASGNIFLAGHSTNASSTTTQIATPGSHQPSYGGGSFDAFLAKFNSSGVRQWATYYGGSGTETGYSCATDVNGNVYLTGLTSTSVGISIATTGSHQQNFGGSSATPYDAFLVKFDSNGNRQWGTYYGGAGDDQGLYCQTDPAGNVYFTGKTSSTSNIAAGGNQTIYGGGTSDVFMVKCNSSGVRQWSTYYGGPSSDIGNSCALDALGNIYLAGTTQSSVGIALGGYQNNIADTADAFLAKFCGQNPNLPSAVNGNTMVCVGSTHIYSVSSVNSATGYFWVAPAGWSGSSPSNTISILVGASGVLSVSASNACGASAAQTLSITSEQPPIITVNSGTICFGEKFVITPSGASTYSISGGASMVSPLVSTSYSVTGTSSNGCISSNAATLNVTVAQCLAIDELKSNKNLAEVFPNPNNGTFEIRAIDLIGVEIYNETGQSVCNRKSAFPDQTMRIEGLAKGIYLVRILYASKTAVQKIVVVSE